MMEKKEGVGQGCREQVEEGRILQDPKSSCRVRQGRGWEARGETQALSRNLDVTCMYSEGSGEPEGPGSIHKTGSGK